MSEQYMFCFGCVIWKQLSEQETTVKTVWITNAVQINERLKRKIERIKERHKTNYSSPVVWEWRQV